MLAGKPEDGDDSIDGDRPTVLTKLLSRAKTSPPYLIYGGLMGMFAIFLVTMYVLYRTFNYKVILLGIVVALVGGYVTYHFGWQYGGIATLLVLFFGGMLVAYLNLRAFAAIDATVVPGKGTAIDERWDTSDVIIWLRENNLESYETRFRDAHVDGAMLVTATPDRLGALPFGVQAGDRDAFLKGIEKGKELSEERRKQSGEHQTEAQSYRDMAARSEGGDSGSNNSNNNNNQNRGAAKGNGGITGALGRLVKTSKMKGVFENPNVNANNINQYIEMMRTSNRPPRPPGSG